MTSHFDRAKEVVKRLQEAGYTAFFAGGWVRDHCMNRPCEDIDIATSAHPEEVLRLFPRAIAIGAQFGVVRVLFDSYEFEVATFRSDAQYVDGRRPVQVALHSSPEEDAKRRDFTINGLFYDPIAEQVHDYVGGRADIERRVVRAIGCPRSRFQEDRLRLIRAIRFKNVLGFFIEIETWTAMCDEAAHVFPAVSPERIWQELLKMMEKGVLAECLSDMAACGLLEAIFPVLKSCSQSTLLERIALVRRYSGGSLVSAIALLFLGSEKGYLASLGDAYHLSKREQREIGLFLQYGAFEQGLSDAALVPFYAKPESDDYIKAVACLREGRDEFLQKHQQKRAELAFWIEQVKKNSFLITGEDLVQRGISPGRQMGLLLAKAFELSIERRIQDKETLLLELFR